MSFTPIPLNDIVTAVVTEVPLFRKLAQTFEFGIHHAPFPASVVYDIKSSMEEGLCAWKIDKGYMRDVLSKSNLIITFTEPRVSAYWLEDSQAPWRYVAAAIFLEIKDKKAELHLICSNPGDVEGLPKLPLAPLLHCAAIIYLKKVGVEEVYLDAADRGLIKYYQSFGYELSKTECNPNLITKTKKWLNPASDVPKKISHGFRMKLCSLDDNKACEKAFLTLAKIPIERLGEYFNGFE